MTKPDGISQKYYEYLQACGWDDTEIQRIASDCVTMRANIENRSAEKARSGYSPRDITCSNYEQAQGRLHKAASRFIAGKARTY